MNDVTVLAVIVLSFALLATAHVTIVVGLARRSPRWRALAALVLLPLAPYWALRARMRVRGVAWLFAFVAYVIARAMA